jgi:hypothetical protein
VASSNEPHNVLDLMMDARNRWRTLRATLRFWEDTVLAREALRLLVPDAPPVGQEEEPRFVAMRQVWARKPYRWRIEYEGPDGANVFVGDLAWSEPPRSPPNAPRRPQAEPSPDALPLEAIDETVAYTFDPRILLEDLFITRVFGHTEHAGREALRVLAMDEGSPNRFLGRGADDYELLVDSERGVLLRSAARTKGEEFQVTEILGLACDEDLPEGIFVTDEVFDAEPPPGA